MDQQPIQPGEESLEAQLVALFDARGLSLAVAESLTGGLLAAALTSVPGASGFFRGGVVAYSDMAKTEILSVPTGMIGRVSAVSAEVAEAMARAAQHLFIADVAVAVTGEAGPSSASGRPVGTVYMALASNDEVRVTRLVVAGGREAIRRQVVQHALTLLRDWVTR